MIVRMNITVPGKLRRKMAKYDADTNWSLVAQLAYAAEVERRDNGGEAMGGEQAVTNVMTMINTLMKRVRKLERSAT